MTLIQPCCIQEGLKTSGLIANSNSMITVMDDMLKEVRSCIECNGAEKFLVFINVLQAEGRYVILGCHIFSKLHIMCMYVYAYMATNHATHVLICIFLCHVLRTSWIFIKIKNVH